MDVILFSNTLLTYDIPATVPPKKLPPAKAELSPPEMIPGKTNLIAPGLLEIVPSVPEIAAPPMAPPKTALHVLAQSHFTGFHCLIEQK